MDLGFLSPNDCSLQLTCFGDPQALMHEEPRLFGLLVLLGLMAIGMGAFLGWVIMWVAANKLICERGGKSGERKQACDRLVLTDPLFVCLPILRQHVALVLANVTTNEYHKRRAER